VDSEPDTRVVALAPDLDAGDDPLAPAPGCGRTRVDARRLRDLVGKHRTGLGQYRLRG